MSNFGVIKRDGSRTEFEIQRIINAIKKKPRGQYFR